MQMSPILLGLATLNCVVFASIRIFLTSTATATLISAFVLSRIDYCSSLLFGSTHDVISHFQRIQNYAARVILRLPRSSNITTHSKSLHWLPVKVRSTYNIACLCYHCHSSTAQSYVADMLQKSHHTPATLAPAHTPFLLSMDQHTTKQHLVIARLLLLLLLYLFIIILFILLFIIYLFSIPNDFRCAPSLSSHKSRLMKCLFRSVYKDGTFSLITVYIYIGMAWLCYSFVDGLS